MFYKAALDISERGKKPNHRFYSCVKFVSDACTPAVFYLNKEWATHDILEDSGIDVSNLVPAQLNLLKERDLLPENPKALDSPALVYLEEGSWEKHADPETGASGLIPTFGTLDFERR